MPLARENQTGAASQTDATAHVAELRDAGGAVTQRAEMRGGVLHGAFAQFGPDGLATVQMHFVDGQRDGQLLAFDAEGAEAARLTYRAGLLDGPATLSSRGRKVAELTHALGVADGPFRTFAPSGALASDGILRQGKLHGMLTVYRPDGTVLRRTPYADGLPHGVVEDVDENGVVRRRAEYKAGRLDGDVTDCDATGAAIARTYYAADKPERVCVAPGEDVKPHKLGMLRGLLTKRS